MKKIIRIYIAIIASVCLFMSLPADIYAVVIDVSSYNGFIQWDNMKNYIEGTIIRIGYGNDIQSQDDAAAIRNMNECERLGIPYGVYLYSYALDYYDAASETAHALRVLKGRSPELGVWFDMEDADGYKARNGLDVYSEGELLSDFCEMFVNAMRISGYKTGVYANYNYFTNVLNLDRLKSIPEMNIWLAHWGIDSPSLDCTMWQFGAVEIEDEEYDGNIYYSDYSVKNDDNTGETIRTDDSSSNSINVYYQTKLAAGRWLPVVKNNEDYAGIRGQNITGLAVTTDTGYIKYRVHVGSGWLDFIDSRNTDINDYYNGYAGNDTPVDAVEIYYYTPDDIINSSGYNKIDSNTISFGVAPRINACGRMGKAEEALELFLSKDKNEVNELTNKLNEHNRKRQETEKTIFENAVEKIKEEHLDENKAIIVGGENWHHGVIGIVSSKITEMYFKPSILFSFEEDGIGKGSGRSIPGFDLHEALMKCSDTIEKFGGHSMAVGITVKKDNLEKFKKEFEQIATQSKIDEIIPIINIDAKVDLSDIDKEMVESLKQLEPFGEANKMPVFAFKNLKIDSIRALSEGKHLKLTLKDNNYIINAIGFNIGYLANEYRIGDKIDVAGVLEINTFNGVDNLQINIKDIMKSI